MMKYTLMACFLLHFMLSITDSVETPKKSTEAIVKLLIVGDRSLLARFGNDRDKIYQFISNNLWDVNMRFKTFVKTKLEIRVVDVILPVEPEEQPYDEKLSITNDSFKPLLHDFSKWLFRKAETFKKFDISVLVSGLYFEAKTGYTQTKSVCTTNYMEQRQENVGVRHLETEYKHFTTSMTRIIALMLGADFDRDSGTCKRDMNIMGENYTSSLARFFFSNCTDEAVFAHLQRWDSKCVFQHNTETKDALVGYKNILPPSISEQCREATNDINAFAADTDDRCVKTLCQSSSRFSQITVKVINPLDNSPCAPKSNCFRGRCLPLGYQLRNLGANICVRSSNQFSHNDIATVNKCIKIPTPLDMLRIEKQGHIGMRLIAPYIEHNIPRTQDKCLFVNEFTSLVGFKNCSKSQTELCSLVSANNKRRVFILYHQSTELCIHVKDNQILASPICESYDARFLWRLDVEEYRYDSVVLGLVNPNYEHRIEEVAEEIRKYFTDVQLDAFVLLFASLILLAV